MSGELSRGRQTSTPIPESEYVAKYGKLPTGEGEIEELRELWNRKYELDFEEEWRVYWRDSDVSIDLLERLYMFWAAIRSGVEWPQARASSGD